MEKTLLFAMMKVCPISVDCIKKGDEMKAEILALNTKYRQAILLLKERL